MDEQLLLWINLGWSHPWLDVFFHWISSKATFSFPLLGIIGLTCCFLYGRDGLKLWGLLIAAIYIGDEFGNLLKLLFQQPRPCAVIYDVIRQPGKIQGISCRDMVHGMPSNHALTSILTTVFMTRITVSWRWALCLLPIAILVSLSRVYLGVHYPSQVLVGAALGCILGLFAAYATLKYSIFAHNVQRHTRAPRHRERAAI